MTKEKATVGDWVGSIALVVACVALGFLVGSMFTFRTAFGAGVQAAVENKWTATKIDLPDGTRQYIVTPTHPQWRYPP